MEMAKLCSACTRCGWECAADGSSISSSGLSVHVGVGCGRVRCFHVGSDHRGWQLVVSGPLFEEQASLPCSPQDPPLPPPLRLSVLPLGVAGLLCCAVLCRVVL